MAAFTHEPYDDAGEGIRARRFLAATSAPTRCRHYHAGRRVFAAAAITLEPAARAASTYFGDIDEHFVAISATQVLFRSLFHDLLSADEIRIFTISFPGALIRCAHECPRARRDGIPTRAPITPAAYSFICHRAQYDDEPRAYIDIAFTISIVASRQKRRCSPPRYSPASPQSPGAQGQKSTLPFSAPAQVAADFHQRFPMRCRSSAYALLTTVI